jgi:hypothetical protein
LRRFGGTLDPNEKAIALPDGKPVAPLKKASTNCRKRAGSNINQIEIAMSSPRCDTRTQPFV